MRVLTSGSIESARSLTGTGPDARACAVVNVVGYLAEKGRARCSVRERTRNR